MVTSQTLSRKGNADSKTGLFPIDSVLEGWLRGYVLRISSPIQHRYQSFKKQLMNKTLSFTIVISKIITHLGFYVEGLPLQLYISLLNLSTLSPYVSGPNSVKIATSLEQYVDQPLIQASS